MFLRILKIEPSLPLATITSHIHVEVLPDFSCVTQSLEIFTVGFCQPGDCLAFSAISEVCVSFQEEVKLFEVEVTLAHFDHESHLEGEESSVVLEDAQCHIVVHVLC